MGQVVINIAKLDKIKIISLDIFQTLVDVNARISYIWKNTLDDNYTENRAKEGADAVLQALPAAYANGAKSFLKMTDVFELCAEEAVKKLSFPADPKVVAYQLMRQHGYAPFFPDVLPNLIKLKSKFSVIVSSDSNHLMVDPILDVVKPDIAFISDDLEAYKGDESGLFFQKALQSLKVPGNEVLHIGDSHADILGAKQAGIHACWINRTGKDWVGEIKPDLIISDFNELIEYIM